MKKSLVVFLILILSINCFSQKKGENSKKFDMSRVYYGGNIGGGGGSTGFSILLAPELGYYVLPNLLVATGITYNYMRTNYNQRIYKYNAISPKVFSRFYPKNETISLINNLFAHVEYEYMSISETIVNGNSLEKNQLNLTNFYVGGGYIQRISENFNMYIMILYNLNQEPNNPFQNPTFKIGFGI